MDFVFGGCHTTHQTGAFCTRITREHYFISYFETPFQYELNGKMCSGKAGDMLIQPPGSVIHHGCKEVGFRNTWIYVSIDGLNHLLEKYSLPINAPFAADSGELLEQYVRRATAEFHNQAIGTNEVLQSITTMFIIELYRLYQRLENGTDKLEVLREELACYPQRPWTLENMAYRCGYSISRFCAIYKERFGTSPKQDVLNARLILAKNLLRYTDRTIQDIAETCGFVNAPYFTKYFKESIGITPKEYRKQ